MPVTTYVNTAKTAKGFDPVLAQAQLEYLQEFRSGLGGTMFSRIFFMILAKEVKKTLISTKLIPFEHTRIQRDLQNKAGRRNITLKPRQIGSTTWHIICRLLLPAITEPGTAGLLISQTKGYGAQHFTILQRAVKNFARAPLWAKSNQAGQYAYTTADEFAQHVLHTRFSARHEILFDFLDSKVLVDTAENPDAGTGLTINHLVCTEVAYWMRDPETLLAQAKEAIPANGTLDLESTPNGMGGYFFEEWQRSKNPDAEFTQHFYPWWWHEEYREKVQVEEDTLTAEEEKMMKEMEWTLNQIAWRRGKQKSLRQKFPEKYPEDSTACFLSGGDLFFDRECLRDIKLRVDHEKPLEKFHEGTLKIYKRRIKGRRYLIAADCAEGKLVSTENPDFNAAVVLDIDSGDEMAAYHSRLPPEDFAQDLVDLAQQYNDAVIAPERNGPGASVLLTLNRHLMYGNVYMHREWHRERKMVIPVAGFPTTPRTRPIALNKLAAMVRDAPEFWHDQTFIDECLTFIWATTKKKELFGQRKPQAIPGAHDDTVMARAIGAYVRLVMLGYLDPVDTPSERYGDFGEEEEIQN